MTEALPLHKYLGEIKTGAGLTGYRDLKYRLGNLQFLYSLPFDEITAEIVFGNDIELLDKYLHDYENNRYTLNDGQTWMDEPEDIAEFIYHCHKHWYIIPQWDENLVKRDFKLYEYDS